jgi:lactoylglutathione lyase
MHLYEIHLPVSNTEVATGFYTKIVGLPLAHRDPQRDIVFLWASAKRQGMIGLWGPGTTYGPQDDCAAKSHTALAVSYEELLAAIQNLSRHGIETFGFGGNKTQEPSVIGWMPSAQIYFRDPDGHVLEFISILPDQPRPDFIGPYSKWTSVTGS